MNSVVRALKSYTLSYTAKSAKVTPAEVWSVWTDVNNWPTWDKGLSSCQMKDEFKVGSAFLLQPVGAPAMLTTRLLEVDINRRFKDTTIMPLGNIQVTHEVKAGKDGTEITHTIDANVFEDKIDFFEATLWKKWQTGLSNSVDNIIARIEAQQLAAEQKVAVRK